MTTRDAVSSIALVLFLAGCNMVNSPLSDVPISDPSLLQIIAVANRDVSPDGFASSTLSVNLYDKHGEYVKVMNGKVEVNGEVMTDSYFGSYVRSGEPVTANTHYGFTVTMSDGSRDSCHVRTPADLRTLTVPSSYDRKAPFVVSWSGADPSLPTTVEFLGDTLSVTLSASAGQSSLTVQPASIARLHSGQTLRVTASIRRTGSIDSGFMSTSRVTATFSVARNMRI